MDNRLDLILEKLKAEGLKITYPRTEIIRLFLETNDHLKPEDLVEMVKDKNISVPTVYRNLDVLKQHRIIKEISLHDARYYELIMYSGNRLHVHLKCRTCDALIEYKDDELMLSMLKDQHYVEQTFGALVDDITVLMNGICPKCREQDA